MSSETTLLKAQYDGPECRTAAGSLPDSADEITTARLYFPIVTR